MRRDALIAAGWPHGALVSDNTLDSFVRRLRTRLAALGVAERLATVRAVGYRSPTRSPTSCGHCSRSCGERPSWRNCLMNWADIDSAAIGHDACDPAGDPGQAAH